MECLLAFIEFTQFQEQVIDAWRSKYGNGRKSGTTSPDTNGTRSSSSSPDVDPDIKLKMTLDLKDIHIIQFPTSIPKSSILSESIQCHELLQLHMGGYSDETSQSFDHLFDLKKRAHKLYHKYIKIGAEYEVNISSKMRDPIMDILNDFSTFATIDIYHQELILLFNEVKQEMKVLLEFSLSRFKASNAWGEIDVNRFITV